MKHPDLPFVIALALSFAAFAATIAYGMHLSHQRSMSYLCLRVAGANCTELQP